MQEPTDSFDGRSKRNPFKEKFIQTEAIDVFQVLKTGGVGTKCLDLIVTLACD